MNKTASNETDGHAISLHLKTYIVGLILLSIGAVLVVISLLPVVGEKPADLLKEGGFALFAAGLVMLVVEFSLRLDSHNLMLHSIRTTVGEAMGSANRKLLDSLAEPVRLRMLLNATLRTQEEKDLHLADHLATIIEKLRDLDNGDWEKEVYQEYLSKVLKNARENVQMLCEASHQDSASGDSGGAHSLTLISPAKRTDEILVGLMGKLGAGDRYTVISDLGSWRNDQLDFFEANRLFARRGGEIRRIFNLTLEKAGKSVTVEQARAVLAQHLAASEEYKGYSARLMTEPMGWSSPDHFGFFQRVAGDEYGIHVQFVEVDGEHRELCFRKLTPTAPRITAFNFAWNSLENNELTADRLESALAGWGQGPRTDREGRIQDLIVT